MELRLKNYGTIEITNATLVDGGDIMIEAADRFEGLAETTEYEITNVYLSRGNASWWLIAWLDTQGNFLEEQYISIMVENQNDIYKLKARL
mgnify:CR=1 FL=1